MGVEPKKARSDERAKPKKDIPRVVGLSSFGSICGLTDADLSSSYVVFLNKNNSEHIDQLIKFVNTLNEKPSKKV